MKDKLAALTIFIGSFLIFGIQPMVGRTLLPVFGGTAAVWIVCLCAFQVFLLGGYWYADRLVRASHSPNIRRHLVFLWIAAVLTVLIAFHRSSILAPFGNQTLLPPALAVLASVFVLVGFPYLLLSSNSSLVQAFSAGNYRLYSVSNAGSLLGLMAYPFIFEPYVTLTAQWLGFSVGMAAYAFLLWRLSANNGVTAAGRVANADHHQAQGTKRQALLYFLLPAVSCFLLNAMTTHVTLDVMPLPLIWTASLSIFLCSYIIGFSGLAKRIVVPLAVLTLVLLAGICSMNGTTFSSSGLPFALSLAGAFLLVGCSFLHSWLYLLRPSAERLTRYYLWQSVGGAVGGIVASLVFPFTCKTVAEYPASLAVVGVIAVLFMACSGKSRKTTVFYCVVSLALAATSVCLWVRGCRKDSRPCIHQARGFFGTMFVVESKARLGNTEGHVREFVHGSTIHGIQVDLPGKERMPTCYYGTNAIGYSIVGHPKYKSSEPMRVNLVGMGVGVLFSYARTNDYYRAYEISPDVVSIATNTNMFKFIANSPAKNDIVIGDARKGLEAELASGVEPYDVIVIDAFTGDNIPYHLSTVEAFDLYFKLLKPDGILCVNVSNWHLELLPFMCALGDRYNCPLLGLITRADFAKLQFDTESAFFCRNPKNMAPPPVGTPEHPVRMVNFANVIPMPALPTDEKGSFVDFIRWKH